MSKLRGKRRGTVDSIVISSKVEVVRLTSLTVIPLSVVIIKSYPDTQISKTKAIVSGDESTVYQDNHITRKLL